MHTITTRSPNPEEERLIASRTRPDVVSWGCLLLLFGILPGWLLGSLGRWLGGFHSASASVYGQWLGWSVAALLLGWQAVGFFPYERRLRRRAERDDRDRLVQEIHVLNPGVIEIVLLTDNEPILALDIGEGKILYLQGQWLRDCETYGTTDPDGDPCDETLNGFPPPHAFPSSEFTITRFPHSGDVLAIRVTGKYSPPQALVEALKFEYEFGKSELLDGSLDDIAGVLAREHERRQAR